MKDNKKIKLKFKKFLKSLPEEKISEYIKSNNNGNKYLCDKPRTNK